MERIVIACYKPKPGKNSELQELMKTHWDILNSQGLVTERKPITMMAEDGTVIEVFGWKSKEAIESAHSNENVLKMWNEYNEVCDYVTISSVPESQAMFSEFTPLNF